MRVIDRALCFVFSKRHRRWHSSGRSQRRGMSSTFLERVPVGEINSPPKTSAGVGVISRSLCFQTDGPWAHPTGWAWVWARPLSSARMDGTAPPRRPPFRRGSGLLNRNGCPVRSSALPACFGDNQRARGDVPFPALRSVTMHQTGLTHSPQLDRPARDGARVLKPGVAPWPQCCISITGLVASTVASGQGGDVGDRAIGWAVPASPPRPAAAA